MVRFGLPKFVSGETRRQFKTMMGTFKTAYLDTRYDLQPHDGVCVSLKTTASRSGKNSVLEGLGEEGKHTPEHDLWIW